MELRHAGPLVSAEWLVRNTDSDIVIIDCRWDLFDGEKGNREYLKGHVPGARFVSMESELADLSRKKSGRHPLPEADKFASAMESAGVGDSSVVICYDSDGSGSARLWFLLNLYGHGDVYIVDGGIDAYVKAGGKLTTEIPVAVKSNFTPVKRNDMIAAREEIMTGKLNMVDVRAGERYRGIFEPIDPKKGHIPGASNFPHPVFMKDGRYRSVSELKDLMREIGDSPVFYCGSGITSCVPYVASVIAGKRARIYPGSWSEWVSFEDSEVETSGEDQ